MSHGYPWKLCSACRKESEVVFDVVGRSDVAAKHVEVQLSAFVASVKPDVETLKALLPVQYQRLARRIFRDVKVAQ